MKRTIVLVTMTSLLGACGGGGGSVMPAQNASSRPGGTASATMTVIVPHATTSSAARRPQYVSTATQSIAVTPSGGVRQVFALTPSSPNCVVVNNGGSNLSCTLKISAPVAQNESLGISTYASTDGTGAALSNATIVANIVSGQNNPLAATLNGIVASLSVAIAPATTTAGTSATVPVTVNALDAAGRTIIGPGGYSDASGNAISITLTTSDAAKTTLSSGTVSAPGTAVNLAYNGSPTKSLYVSQTGSGGLVQVFGPSATYETVTVTAAASGAANAVASLTLTPAVTGNVAPLHSLVTAQLGSAAGSNRGIAFDASGNMYISYDNAGLGTDFVDVYAPPFVSGTPSPTRSIGGLNTELVSPWGITVDGSGVLYVANRDEYGSSPTPNITEYASGANGNVAPIRTIGGANTGINQPMAVAISPVNGDVGVVNYSASSCMPDNKTLVFPTGTNGNVAPTRDIVTGCSALFSIAYDQNGVIYEGNNNSNAVNVYGPTATSETQAQYITGSNTQITAPYGVAVDASGYLYVISSSGSSILVFAPGAIGNVAPIETIAGGNTGLSGALFLTVGP
jgi:hypothetical protein